LEINHKLKPGKERFGGIVMSLWNDPIYLILWRQEKGSFFKKQCVFTRHAVNILRDKGD
jgi:hypothetical protein